MSKTWKGRLRQRVIRAGIRTALNVLRGILFLLPRRSGLWLGERLGGLAFRWLRTEREKAFRNFRIALAAEYTPDEQARIIKASFQNQGKNLVEVLQLSRSTPSQIHSMVSFEGEGCLKEAADRGRGVIFVTAHLGNWELMAVAVAMRFPLSVVAAPIYDPKIEEIMVGLRKTYSIETVVRGQPHSLRRLLTALKNRGVVGMLMDQDTRVDGAFVPFFGREAYTPIGPASLALRTGAAVVTGFIIRLPDHRHRIVVRGPVELTQTGDRKSDIQANTDRFTQAIEGFVRAFPDQWIWMHERWKRGGQISNLSPSRNQ